MRVLSALQSVASFWRWEANQLLMSYHEALCRAMSALADCGAVFLGQAVACDGTALRSTLKHLPPERLIEMPVAENMQAGMCVGISLAGGFPVCCFPRLNFALEAVSQIVQHADKLPLFSDYRPRVIFRTGIATDTPLDPGPQHVGNYVLAFRAMLQTVQVREMFSASQVTEFYEEAMAGEGSWLMVEHLGMYND